MRTHKNLDGTELKASMECLLKQVEKTKKWMLPLWGIHFSLQVTVSIVKINIQAMFAAVETAE